MSHKYPAISKIEIRNFRGLEELNLAFDGPGGEPPPLVVLAGPNGCGKTAVLEACLLATRRRELVRGAVREAAVHKGASEYSIRIEVCWPGDPPWRDWCIATHEHEEGTGPKMMYFSSWRAPSLVGAVGLSIGKRSGNAPKREENRLLRIKQVLVNAKAHERLSSASTNGGSSERLPPYSQLEHELNECWQRFYPDERFEVAAETEDPEAGFDVYRLDEAGHRLSVDALSSGQIEVFCFIGSLLVEKFWKGIILIDEPELHLDPQWHRPLLSVLTRLRPGCQVIVATHSREVSDSVRSFERFVLVSDDDPRAEMWKHVSAEPVV